MRRRRALRLLGSPSLLLAGCLGSEGAERGSDTTVESTASPTERSPTATPTDSQPDRLDVGDTLTTDRGVLAVASPTVQRSVVADIGGLYRTVVRSDEYQLLVVDVRGVPAVSPDDFVTRQASEIGDWPAPGCT